MAIFTWRKSYFLGIIHWWDNSCYNSRNFIQKSPSKNTKFSHALFGGIVLGIIPQIGVFGLTLWKDVLFTVGCLYFLNIQINKSLNNRSLNLAAAGILISSLRWNGFLVIIIFELIIFLKNRKVKIKEWLVLSFAVIIGVSSLLVPPALGIIDSVDSRFFNSTRLHDIAVLYDRNPEKFNINDQNLLKSVAPLNEWKIAGSQCLTHDNLMFTMFPKNTPDSFTNFLANSNEFIKIWNNLLIEEPSEIVRARICRARSTWDPTLLYGVPQILPSDIPLEASKYGVIINTDEMQSRKFIIESITKSPFKFFWSAPFVFLLYALSIPIRFPRMSAFGRKIETSAVIPLGIAILLSTALSQVAQDLRYNFSVVIILLVTLISSLFGLRNKKDD